VKFEVDPKLVEPIIRDQIAAAVVASLGDPADMIRQMVTLSLEQKVNADGIVSQYSSENRFDLIEALSAKAIREAAKEAIQRVVRESAPLIEAEITRQIKAAPKKTAAAVMAGFMGLASQPSNYRLSANFVFASAD
jgi:high-affinity K+ transport system ATPase subunit B